MTLPAGLEFLYPHHIAEEPYPEHCYQPTHHLDVKGSILVSHLTQVRVVEQLWRPRDEEFFRGRVPNAGLHQSLQSYLVWGVLMEQEIFNRMEQIRTSYLKLLGKVTTLRAGRGGDSEWAMEPSTQRASEVKRRK
ncbi:uncharacterized protein A4U43_C10F14630 [Asparagus officinalis]|uniref:Uncharacterized protein n=1 Tax=Asparagus officinalis TaxID=4686 RepID=A0A5P1E368_ASPOF|nr:uncharacterized protein A4U43_C10F14630 [Asparagus officinalis]